MSELTTTTIFLGLSLVTCKLIRCHTANNIQHEKENTIIKSSSLYWNCPDRIAPFSITTSKTDLATLHSQIATVVQTICSEWKNITQNQMEISVVSGGITNLLYQVKQSSDSVSSLLVRIYGEKTEILIDRENENKTFAELSKRNYAPDYFGRFENGRIEGYISNTRSLHSVELGKTSPIHFVKYIAQEMASLHTIKIPMIDTSAQLWKVKL